MVKLGFKLASVLVGIVGGVLARAMFTRVWHSATGEDRKPEPGDRNATWREIVLAAALEGALFAAVRALLDRASVASLAKVTGEWPD